jgi:hypothetical protein
VGAGDWRAFKVVSLHSRGGVFRIRNLDRCHSEKMSAPPGGGSSGWYPGKRQERPRIPERFDRFVSSSKVTSFPRSLSPRRRGAGIQFLLDLDPRFRGGDVLNFTSMGAPLAHDHSAGMRQAYKRSTRILGLGQVPTWLTRLLIFQSFAYNL